MTAALDYACKKIPADREIDSAELRKQIANELIRCARSGKRTVIDLQNAGLKILKGTKKLAGFNWVRAAVILSSPVLD